MANTFITNDITTFEALDVLENTCEAMVGINSEYDDSVSQYESLADQRQEDPLDGTFRREMARVIADRLQELPEMQRKVLALYYFEDMRLREIAEAFGLTESRICQIHAQGILAIKSFLLKFDPHFA